MGMLFSPPPSAPSIPPPPPPPPPKPDINQIQEQTQQEEQLSRKPKSITGNLLTGSLGNSNNFGSGSKTLLGG